VRPELAYGEEGDATLRVPANSTVIYEVELLGWVAREDLFGDGGCVKTRLKEGPSGTWRMPKYLDEVLISYKVTDGEGAVVEEKAEVEHLIGSPTVGSLSRACDAALKSMLRQEVVKLECTKDYLWGDEPGRPRGGAVELTLLEIYETRDVSFCRDRSLMKKQIREGEGFEKPRDLCKVALKVLAATDGTQELDGFRATTLEFTAGNGEVCDALEFIVLEMKRGERAVADCARPESCVEARLGLTRAPDARKVVLTVELQDFENGKEVWGMTAEEKIRFAVGRKEAAAALFKEGRLELAMERYKKIIELFSVIENYESEPRESARELRKACRLNMAACHLKLRRYEEAKKACGEVLREDEDNVKALYRRAQAHLATKDVDDAVLDAKKVLLVEPQNNEARKLLAECRGLQKGKDSQANDMLANMIKKGLSSPPEPPPRPDQATFNRLKDLIEGSPLNSAGERKVAPAEETLSKVQAALDQEPPTPESVARKDREVMGIQEENFLKIKALIAQAERPACPDAAAGAPPSPRGLGLQAME